MSVRVAETEPVVHRLVQVIILKKSGEDTMQLLLIRKLAADCDLRLMELCRGHHLHRRSDLQRILDGGNPALYFI